jgi:hypothetical protein
MCDTGRTALASGGIVRLTVGKARQAWGTPLESRDKVMTPGQVRDRIRELEDKFSRIKAEFLQVAHGQKEASSQKSEVAASGDAGEIREDRTRDR